MIQLAPPSLVGEKVRLRPAREEDMRLLHRWIHTPEVRHWLHASDRPDGTLEEVTRRFWSNWDAVEGRFWIIETAEGRPAGNVRLLGIDLFHLRAELAISIGEPDCFSLGLGTDAIRLVLGYAFEDLGLRRVDLQTDADNARAIRCYEKCGFVREGVLRARRLRYGEPIDMLAMGVLREEWQAGQAS